MNSRIALTALASVLIAGLYAETHNVAAAQPITRARQAQQARPPAVVTGHVAAVHGAIATVATADRPVCPPPATPAAGVVRCNAIIAGTKFQVDTSHAVFETAAGAPMQGARPRLAVGDSVVVVGAAPSSGATQTVQTNQPLIRATVIQRIASCAGR